MSELEEFSLQLIEKSATDIIMNNGSFVVEQSTDDNSPFIRYKYVAKSIYTTNCSITIAKVKPKGKITYIGISKDYREYFDINCVEYSEIPSDNYLRFQKDDFEKMASDGLLTEIIEMIIQKSFNQVSFGCCSKYIDCSDAGHCLHEDYFYANAACSYKKHLDKGEIFYGKNANKREN